MVIHSYRNEWYRIIGVVLITTVLCGFILLRFGHASGTSIGFEAETGQLAHGVVIASDTSASSGATIKFAPVVSGTMLFQDDFTGPNGASFDHSKWHQYSACGYNSSAAYGNIKCGEDETLDGEGHLVIPATPTRGQSLMTGDNFKFTYGTASAWIKFPQQVGYWPAFWTLNSHADGSSTPYLGEADVMEGYTTWEDGVIARSGYHAGFHNWANTGSVPHTSGGPDLCAKPGIDLSAAFHKYSVKIEPNKISFYFDDIQCGTTYGLDTNPGKPYGFGPNITNGNWLILTLAVGGAGGQQKPAVDNAHLLVDRIEVRAN